MVVVAKQTDASEQVASEHVTDYAAAQVSMMSERAFEVDDPFRGESNAASIISALAGSDGLSLADLQGALSSAEARLATLESGVSNFLSTPNGATLVVQGSLRVRSPDDHLLVVGEQADGSFGISMAAQ
jgi:hypothetical protein